MVAIERKTRDWQKNGTTEFIVMTTSKRLGIPDDADRCSEACAESYRGFPQKEATLIGIAGMTFAAALRQFD